MPSHETWLDPVRFLCVQLTLERDRLVSLLRTPTELSTNMDPNFIKTEPKASQQRRAFASHYSEAGQYDLIQFPG